MTSLSSPHVRSAINASFDFDNSAANCWIWFTGAYLMQVCNYELSTLLIQYESRLTNVS